MAFLSGWLYRKPVTLSRASGAVTNYQMKLKVGESAGSGANDVLATGCKTDFSDLRFTKEDGDTLLDYYIEDVTGTTPNQVATVWIEFDSIGTGATTFYMYYGNAGAAAASNGANTFILFEDFNSLTDGDIRGQNGWSASAATAFDIETTVKKEGAKALTVTAINDGGTCKKTISPGHWNVWVECYLRASNVADTNAAILNLFEGASEVAGIEIGTSRIEALAGTTPFWETTGVTAVNGTWYKVKIALDAKTTHKVWVDDVLKSPAHSNNYTTVVSVINGVYVRRWNMANSPVYFDLLKIGQYLATEPAWGSWGAQELGLQHYTLALEPASFSMTGTAILLPRSAISLGLSPGAYSMVGSPLFIWKAHPPIVMEAGAFAMTGADLSIKRPTSYMRMDPGAFAMNGTPMDPHYGWYRGASTLNYQFPKQRRQF